jgi:hypothetical protein
MTWVLLIIPVALRESGKRMAICRLMEVLTWVFTQTGKVSAILLLGMGLAKKNIARAV